MDLKLSDFEELKQLALKQTNGSKRRGAARLLSYGMLWSLELGIHENMIADLLELLRFELDRKRADDSKDGKKP